MPSENYQIWLEGVNRIKYPRENLPSEIETLIIGGGITGITFAYLLARENRKVVLLEKDKVGGRATIATTGFLTGVIDTNPIDLIKIWGEEKAKLIFASHIKAIDAIEEIVRSEKIECEFERCTNYIYANSKSEEKKLLKISEAYNKLGVKSEYKDENKFNGFCYIEMPSQATFHAVKYTLAMAEKAVKYGAIIAEDTEATGIKDNGENVTVEIKDVGSIMAKKVISATYLPFGKPKPLMTLCNMYRSYVIEYKVSLNKFEPGTYEDTNLPYHYFRLDNTNDSYRLIIGGADHLDIIEANREINFNTIRGYSKKLFSESKLEETRYWSGLILETNDELAYIGKAKEKNIFYAFGFSGNGLTYSYIAGKIFLDQTLSQKNNFAEVYDIGRKLSWWKKLYLK
jgi:glycine/D-amino acid oxidase-like deaminating enzyme